VQVAVDAAELLAGMVRCRRHVAGVGRGYRPSGRPADDRAQRALSSPNC
jgi:hypothetical protein